MPTESPTDHVVHFFDGDDDLVGTVISHLTASVVEGDGVIVIATHEHRNRFRAALTAAGVDVTAAEQGSRLVMLDAAGTLALFTTGAGLDVQAFRSLMEGLVQDASGQGRPVRVYGEMVVLLGAAGRMAAALELESMWNELETALPFSLFCAYPAGLFEDPDAAAAFNEVCHLHSDVVAGAPRPVGSDVVRRFPRATHSVRLARRFVSDTLSEWFVPAPVVDDVVLVTSELVTNALRHAASDVVVGLTLTPARVRVVVADASDRAPAVQELGLRATTGRGLMMVGSLASAWGHDELDGGKVVWADIPV